MGDRHDSRPLSLGVPALGLDDMRLLDCETGGRDLIAGYHRAGLLVAVIALGGRAVVARAARCRTELIKQPALSECMSASHDCTRLPPPQ
ncbi:hypothetical protein ACGF7W_01195 [Streptomyces sp. NPDC048219]|uniref:hypothetical protein n=1 Tax=unclassified Streptomyces TaxID=2593676 RepID=UPI003417F6EB